MKIIVAHTPDADDAFMFYAMTHGKVKSDLEIEHLIEDIESLNKKAFDGKLDATALSAHAYAYLHDKYRILSAGASVGDGYGPIVVAKQKIELNNKRIAIPGKYTTANLLLNLALDNFKPVEMRFDEIINAVKSETVDAGLLIHEGQITYEMHGLKKLLDLWEWWSGLTKLPLPLGINVIKRSIPIEIQKEFLRVMKESVKYALNNVDEAIDYAMRYSRGLDRETTKRFALMYVNEYTYEMPNSVVKALELLYKMGMEKGLIEMPRIDILF
ncbi:ABC transporter substrate-binding protein [Archaeoglobales archaeon]|nr:MAG: ABC transporter substrate-binding protein [Archaeoglobales archaeon]